MEILARNSVPNRKVKTKYNFDTLAGDQEIREDYIFSNTVRASVSYWNSHNEKKLRCFKSGDFIIVQVA